MGDRLPDGIAARTATTDDLVGVMRVVDGALLDVEADVVRDRIRAGDVHLAVAGHGTDRERVVGAVVVTPQDGALHVAALAVRRNRRGRGIGTALVERVVANGGERDVDRLTAAFDDDLRSFYADLGFDVERRDGRLWGERLVDADS